MIKSNMPKFECKTCGFTSDKKSEFRDHMNFSVHSDAAMKKFAESVQK